MSHTTALKIDFTIPFRIESELPYSSYRDSYVYYNSIGCRESISYANKQAIESQYVRYKRGEASNYMHIYIDNYSHMNNGVDLGLSPQAIQGPTVKEEKPKLNLKLLLI